MDAVEEGTVRAAFNSWEDIAPWYQELLDRPIADLMALERWIADRSKLEAALGEDIAWRYIDLSANSEDAGAAKRYQEVVSQILPRLAPLEHQLNEKLIQCPLRPYLDGEKYGIFLRNILNSLELYQEKNIPLQTNIHLLTKEYTRIFAQMSIEWEGQKLTLQQGVALLEDPQAVLRERAYRQVHHRIHQDYAALEHIFDQLVVYRHRIAQQAGLPNFQTYAFRDLGRLDYSPQDCLELHRSIAVSVLPILDELYAERRTTLGLETLRPWDLQCDRSGKPPLLPFNSMEDLLHKSITCLNRVHPDFGAVIQTIHQMGFLDLESRPGKRPGGYNMPLQATRLPFLFMNATHSLADMRTLLHESGHAVHFYLSRDYDLLSARRFPPEISELAAMSMELLSMEHWEVFFDDPDELRRARLNQLENVLKVLPWIACIDDFQHWIYTHPNHSRAERRKQWLASLRRFTPACVDLSGLEEYLEYQWHKQLHLFEVPFYYIEYGFAQLGAIALWRNYRHDPEQASKAFVAALKLGNTRSIREVYATAGISFSFDADYLQQLAAFVRAEIHALR